MFIVLLSNIVNGSNHTKCFSLNNQKCMAQIRENKYLMLVPTNESKEKIKKCEKLWSKIRDLIRLITKNSLMKNT